MKFNGTTEQCLHHLAATAFDRDPGEALASFVGATKHPTVDRWFSNRAKPVGEYLLKIRYFLELLGYHVNELEMLDPTVRDAGRLVAFSIIEPDDLAKEFGYRATENAKDSMMRVLFGKSVPSADKIEKARQMLDACADLVEEKRREIIGNLPVPKKAGNGQDRDQRIAAVAPAHVPRRQDRNESVIDALANMVKAMIPIADLVLSDDFSPEQRKNLRERADVDGVFRLSNLLNRLCGERARNQL